MKAIALFSGGLDSILAVKVISALGINVLGVVFETPFFNANKAAVAARLIDLPLAIINITEKYLEMLKKPRYGYGRNMNPCIDCHTMMLHYAGQKMLETGAYFIFTGEVLGQRPMSQTKQSLKIVAKNSGFSEYILRPLSAKLLPEITLETEGKIDRDKLLAIQGRSRQPQMKLAKALGITSYPPPAGGCFLTDPIFSRRLHDLFVHHDNFTVKEIELLKHGRHFRIDNETKIIIGRNKDDNGAIEQLSETSDMTMRLENYPGPTTLISGNLRHANLSIAASLCIAYGDAPKHEVNTVLCSMNGENSYLTAQALDKDAAKHWMI